MLNNPFTEDEVLSLARMNPEALRMNPRYQRLIERRNEPTGRPIPRNQEPTGRQLLSISNLINSEEDSEGTNRLFEAVRKKREAEPQEREEDVRSDVAVFLDSDIHTREYQYVQQGPSNTCTIRRYLNANV